jgi:hypothetical protein
MLFTLVPRTGETPRNHELPGGATECRQDVNREIPGRSWGDLFRGDFFRVTEGVTWLNEPRTVPCSTGLGDANVL